MVNDTEYINIGQRLRIVLKHKKISHMRLAEELDLNTATVGAYAMGKKRPNLEHFYQICKVLDVSADYLLGLSDEMEIQKISQ